MNSPRRISLKRILISGLIAALTFLGVSAAYFKRPPKRFYDIRWIHLHRKGGTLQVETIAYDSDNPFSIVMDVTLALHTPAPQPNETLDVIDIPTHDRIVCTRPFTGESVELVLTESLTEPFPSEAALLWSEEAAAVLLEFRGRSLEVRSGRIIFWDRVIEILIQMFILACAAGVAAFGLLTYGALVFREFRSSRGKCPNCGYRLSGIDSDRCPECGAPIEPR